MQKLLIKNIDENIFPLYYLTIPAYKVDMYAGIV